MRYSISDTDQISHIPRILRNTVHKQDGLRCARSIASPKFLLTVPLYSSLKIVVVIDDSSSVCDLPLRLIFSDKDLYQDGRATMG